MSSVSYQLLKVSVAAETSERLIQCETSEPLVRRPVEIDLDAAYPELGVRSFGRGTFHKPELPGGRPGGGRSLSAGPVDLARLGAARNPAGLGMALHGTARSSARPGLAGLAAAGHGTRLGQAWLGRARHGMVFSHERSL